jgi:exodeoxyribonuclease VII large subunit
MIPGQIPLFGDPPEEPPGPERPDAGGPEDEAGGAPARPSARQVAREAAASAASTAAALPPPGTAPESAIPVTELNERARRLVEGAFGNLWVSGEITNWGAHRSGHCYFSLRDDDAQLSCVMFRSDLARLPAHPEDGMRVAEYGRPTIYGGRGSWQLVVRDIRADGEGLWKLAFEKLKAKLAAEGLLDPARKRPLPRVPACIGVVTSRSGAALRDVVAVTRRRAPWARVLVSDCRVQGDGAARSIAVALDRLVRHGACDVIILTRGGGSVEDLWAFNEEVVARAIAACPVPTVSAVGHEIDVTIADLVADFRAPTPSAAAESVVPEAEALRKALRARAAVLVDVLRRRTRRGRERARRATSVMAERSSRGLRDRRGRLDRAAGRLDALSPLGTLRRGYAVALGEEGRVLRRAEEFHPGGAFRLRVTDGNIQCRTESRSPAPESAVSGDDG